MKTLYLDIETAPNLSWVWGHYDQNVIKHVEPWYVLCVGWMWEGEGKPYCHPLHEHDWSEESLLYEVWELLDEADIIVAHNGDKFDLRKLNARFIHYGFTPPSPYKTVDTLKVARSRFAFNQNGLDPLSSHLGLGTKAKHEGFSLWEKCMQREPVDRAAWKRMVRYCKQDVVLLRKLYLKLRPWATTHPIVSVGHACPRCGSAKLQRRGMVATRTMSYQQWWCKDCGSWSRSRVAEVLPRPELV